MILRRLGVHLGLFFVASAVAFAAAQKPKNEGKPLEVELWTVKPEAVTRVYFKDSTREVVLTPRSDAHGRYLVGKVTKTIKAVKPAAQAVGDAGVGTVLAPEPPAEPDKTEVESFVGVKEANEIVDEIASLRAVRKLGTLPEDKLGDFGLTGEKLGEIAFEVDGTTHSFVVGGRTPGGGDVYVREKSSGLVYVMSGDVTRAVELADNRLMERELLTTPEGKEVAKVTLTQGDKSRTIIHSTEAPSFWTDETAPADKNETVTNWMKKFERLRASSYVEGEPSGVEPLVTATFTSPSGETLGRIELAKQAVAGAEQPRYLARSPQTRWWAVVLSSTGSELATDLPSVLE
jgi:Domain of unknown function (DUF4340)